MSSFLEEKIQKRYSSARVIRKTALRANCGYRRCFTHEQALTAYRCPLAKTCKHVFCFPYTVWLNCNSKINTGGTGVSESRPP